MAIEAEEAAKRAPVDLAELSRMMAETVERARANDPAALRARILELEEEVERERDAQPEPERVVVPDRAQVVALTEAVGGLAGAEESMAQTLALALDAVRDAGDGVMRAISPLHELVRDLREQLDGLGRVPAEGRRAAGSALRVTGNVERGTGNGERRTENEGLSPGARSLHREMRALAPLKLSRTQLATILRRGAKSSALTQQLGELKAAGMISDDGGWLVLDESGSSGLSPAELTARWRECLPDGPRLLLDELLHHEREVPRDELFRAAGFSPTSSAPVTHLKLLRDNDLAVVRNGAVRLGPALANVR
ncbi:MAG: hypothetical protein ACRDMZ_22070, partial [Solirubrobacteraceae bacterium]